MINIKNIKKKSAIFFIICLIILIMYKIIAFAQRRDEEQPTIPPSAPPTPPVTTQPNIPKPPSVPQLPSLPQTTVAPTLPSLPKLPTLPTNIVNGEYSGVELDESGKKKISIKNTKGNEVKFLLTEDSKIFKGGNPISIEEIKNGEAVVVHYETKQEEGEEKENILKSLFVVIEETKTPKEKTETQEDLKPEKPISEENQE